MYRGLIHNCIICHIHLIPAPNYIMFQIHTLALLDDKRDNVTLLDRGPSQVPTATGYSSECMSC